MSDLFRFGDFELDPAAYALRRAGSPIRLERLPMEGLIHLVASAGLLVERHALQASLWRPGVFVEHDSALNTVVRKIRRALGDEAETPRFVETVVGKGYRFIAPVERRGPITRQSPAASYRVTRGRQEFVLQTGENLIGRDPDARVLIDHASVSRRHARVVIERGQAVLEDLQSRNGTFLNGQRIVGAAPLLPGAVIGLGPITLTFLVVATPVSTQPMSGT
jgi:DNA-binding winged helix-turn-helix (wHTH) protein